MQGSGDKQRLRRDEQLDILQRTFGDALVRGDETLAEDTIAEAIRASFDEGEIDDQIVAPAMRLVGDLWAAGQLGIEEEHLATEISLRVLTVQREAFRIARGRAQHRVLFAAVQGEEHIVGLRMAASMALHAGYDVRMLGANLPRHALLAAVRRHEPSVVGLSATMPASADRLLQTIELLHYSAPEVGIVAGGAAVDERLGMHPGVTICRHVSDLTGQIEALAQRASTN